MELWQLAGWGLGVGGVAVAALRFGHDSRDGRGGHWLLYMERGTGMHDWYALETYAAMAQQERLDAAAHARLVREAQRANRSRRPLPAIPIAMALRTAIRSAAAWAGTRLIRLGEALQALAEVVDVPAEVPAQPRLG